MSIRIETAEIQISKRMLGLTRDRHTTSLLRRELESLISTVGGYILSSIVKLPTKFNLQPFIDDFSEHLASGALDNLKTYYSSSVRLGYTSGGRRAHSKPRVYNKKQITPSGSDIGAIGEGITGYYLESLKKLTFEIRPFDVSPDLIFKDNSKNPTETHLVEVKASLSSKGPNLTIAMNLLSILAKTTFLRKGKYFAHVCKVYIKGVNDWIVKDLIMELMK